MSGRRRRRTAVAGLRPFWFVGSAILAIAIAAGFLVASWPGFQAKRVRIVGNRIVPTAEILAQARVNLHRNMWLQNTGAMAQRIDEIPYILTARVHRVPPAQITIGVTERTPYAIVRSGYDRVLVDASLRVLAEEDDAGSGLPVIGLSPPIALVPGRFLTQPQAGAMRADLAALHAHDVAAVEIDDNGGDVSVVLAGGVRVLLGDESNAREAIPLIEPILTRFALLGRFVHTLDLRSPSTPVVTEGASSRGSTREPRPVRSP